MRHGDARHPVPAAADSPAASSPAGASPAGDAGPAARSPFIRLNELLADIAPGKTPLSLAVGEPRHAMPGFVGEVLARHLDGFGRYPAGKGLPEFRRAAADWFARRYTLPRPLDAEREVLVLNGSREGLFFAALMARRLASPRKQAQLAGAAPAVLLPNPFYAAYGAGAEAAGCESVSLPLPPGGGWLPDLDALDPALLERAIAIYFASPANPQGTIAPRAYLERLVALCRRHQVMVFADECYSEIWLGDAPPTGILEVAGPDYAGVVAFNSLSKRSSLPGLRLGFCAGDGRFMEAFGDFRNVAAPQVPEPLQHVGIAALADEAHVSASRDLYMAKFDVADRLLAGRFGYQRPDGGFFLWLDVAELGGGEAACRRLWQREGLRTVPGGYLCRSEADGRNPGETYLRIALVHDLATTEAALARLLAGLG
ncbi:aminotransferase class I/II-fold pyridoxal phosphate-dependent enzyme [Ancylobacter sp. SL191]|uniref:aminotransferase class I/II-fold pyridoxal phosphate-dependent enzyme n=1 Tax=Ancylobacter sp. SL191 TaxID=2995166 RepID=UPI00226EFE12|nr:aminotransferase class I/II-fold pyridoxal phosphate-dependent enzyme [Ancylobacter sp. SL191]WAC29495.1 aminotransferase class I/II-fold pyridoxal phosphate-dependent enzyme [Ancylobacter sp. SL191]